MSHTSNSSMNIFEGLFDVALPSYTCWFHASWWISVSLPEDLATPRISQGGKILELVLIEYIVKSTIRVRRCTFVILSNFLVPTDASSRVVSKKFSRLKIGICVVYGLALTNACETRRILLVIMASRPASAWICVKKC